MNGSKNSKHKRLPKPADPENPENECLGERKLLCAIIEMALVDACGYVVGGVNQELARSKARKWLLWSRIEAKSPFSFGWICQELNINPYKIRQFVIDSIESRKEYNRCTSRVYGLRGTGDHTTKKNKAGVS